MIRIIDNKKVELTNSEFSLYQEICKSYDRQNFKGEDLFKDLFESDDKGVIIFLRPPQNKAPFSMEIYMFLMSICCHQHIRQMYDQVDDICKQLKEKMSQLDIKIANLDDIIKNNIQTSSDLLNK